MHTYKNATHAEVAAIAANRLYNELRAAESLTKRLFMHSVDTSGDIDDAELNAETIAKLRSAAEIALLIHNATMTAREHYQESTHRMSIGKVAQ